MIKERLEEELGKAHKVMVGSTEQFQGHEREAMILSTVRSYNTWRKEEVSEHDIVVQTAPPCYVLCSLLLT